MKELELVLSLEEIRLMTKSKYLNFLKSRIQKNAFSYLTGKRGRKGKEMKYVYLEMAEYLQPQNNKLTITQKHEMFGVNNRMVNIPYNFPKGEKQTLCVCHEQEDMLNIYNCEIKSRK